MATRRKHRTAHARNDGLASRSWRRHLLVHRGLIVAAAFAALLAYGVVRRAPAEWPSTAGEVVSIRRRYSPVGKRQPEYRVMMAYRYRVDGTAYGARWEGREWDARANEMVWRLSRVPRLRVYYDPASPGRSSPFAPPPRKRFPLKAVGALGILLGLGLAARDSFVRALAPPPPDRRR